MENFQDMFNSAKENTPKGDFERLDDGKYKAEVTNASLDLASQPARVSIEFTLKQSIDGENPDDFKGRKCWANYRFAESSLPYLIQTMQLLELNTENIASPEDLGAELQESIGKNAVVYVSTKDNPQKPGQYFTNVYVNELIGGDDVPGIDENDELGF